MKPALPRRAIAAALAPLLTVPLSPHPAFAFKNGLESSKDGSKKTPGPAPTGLGYRAAPGSPAGAVPGDLKPCLDGRPHCFSSSKALTPAGDTTKLGEDWLVRPFTYSGRSLLEAFDDVKRAVDAYPPGQSGVDGGGFQIATLRLPELVSNDVGYLYVQFESEARGYIDDVEFVVSETRAGEGKVNVRTSSRSGYLDLGVNAKRYNWFAKRLGATKGWKTTPLRSVDHRDYFAQNDLTDKDVGL